MISFFVYIYNRIFSIIYTISTAIIFILLQALTIILPFIILGGISILISNLFPSSGKPGTILFYITGTFNMGAILTSAVTFFNTILVIKIGFSFQEPGLVTNNPSILSLVKEVTNSVGSSDFNNIYLTTKPEISTLYTTGGRYLVISLLAINYLTRNELKSIIAHECGHHHHGTMLINRIHYRTFMLFKGFYSGLRIAEIRIIKLSQGLLTKIFNGLAGPIASVSQLALLFNVLFILIFKKYLEIWSFLVRDSSYEYYCDSIAIKFLGGKIFSKALQKVFDIHLAYEILSKKMNNSQDFIEHLDLLYNYVRNNNHDVRILVAAKKTDTHPALILRLKKARDYDININDISKPLFQKEQFIKLWKQVKNHIDIKKRD